MRKDEHVQVISLEDPENYFYSSDIDVAATLVAIGHQLISLEKTASMRATFVFPRSAKLDADIETYWSGTLRVEPRRLLFERKQLKHRLFASKIIPD